MNSRAAWGQGLVTMHDDTALDAWFPQPMLGELPQNVNPWIAPAELARLAGRDDVRGVDVQPATIAIDLDTPPADTADAYLRLHLLSHRLVRPNSINLDGIFGRLPIVAWTNAGPMSADQVGSRRPQLQRAGVQVMGIDRFPRMTDYVVPDGVRIADAARVRLGAHLSPGTVVMHEGFVNFNAGTLGASMVEGRISQGVIVGDGSDIGGGASIMGTLSGGGSEVVQIGERVLLGANSGVGISIGDDSVVEAGLYVTAGTKVRVVGGGDDGRVVKALDLSGQSGLLFRRNSMTGGVEVFARSGHGVTLNSVLH